MLILLHDSALYQSLLQEHSYVFKDKGTDKLLPLVLIAVLIILARNESLEPHRVDLTYDLLLTLLS